MRSRIRISSLLYNKPIIFDMLGVCIDISGVIHTGKKLCAPNAVASYRKLLDCGKKVMFVTNTSREPNSVLFKNLKVCGFNSTEIRIFSSPEAAKHMLIKKTLKNPFLLIHPNLKVDFMEFSQDSKDESDYDSVVLGNLAETTTYQEINFAFRILRNCQKKGMIPEVISMGNNKYFEDTDHKLSMGTSGFIKSFEEALSNWTPSLQVSVAGKPDRIMFETACEILKVLPNECWMIGDDFHGDVEGSVRCGMFGILVRTGKYSDVDDAKVEKLFIETKRAFIVTTLMMQSISS
jgi:HAD superfamily hydrolase (TIGR01458 family)